MKKKIAVLSLIALLLAVWAFAVWKTNAKAEKPTVETYSMQDTVAYGKDYFRRSDNILDGYTVTVLSAEIVPYEEYAQKQEITLPERITDEAGNFLYRPEYVYDVEVRFSNTDNESGAIDMFDTLLVNDDALMLRVDADLWDCMYPQLAGSYSFRLRPHTEMVFHLPFVVEAVYSERYPMERVQKEKMSLVISQYPVKKVIELK